MPRRLAGLIALLTLGWLWGMPASADAGQLLALVNGARAQAGVPALSNAADLNKVASDWAAAMAARQVLDHNPNLTAQVSNWSVVTENIAYGSNETAAHNLLMNSPGHRANILDSRVTEIGIGVARDARGDVWVCEVFRRPSGAAQPAPAPARQTAPSVSRSRPPASPPTQKSPTGPPKQQPPAPAPPATPNPSTPPVEPVAPEPAPAPAPPATPNRLPLDQLPLDGDTATGSLDATGANGETGPLHAPPVWVLAGILTAATVAATGTATVVARRRRS